MNYIDAIRMQLESIRDELDTVAELMIDAHVPLKELGKVVQAHDLLEEVEKALAEPAIVVTEKTPAWFKAFLNRGISKS
jgi:hypothetical protein